MLWRKTVGVSRRFNSFRYWRNRSRYWFRLYQDAAYAIEDLTAEYERQKARNEHLESACRDSLSQWLIMLDRLSDIWQYEMMSRSLGYSSLGDWIDALRSENHRLSSERQRSGTASSNVSVSITVDASKLIDALQRFDEKYSKRG